MMVPPGGADLAAPTWRSCWWLPSSLRTHTHSQPLACKPITDWNGQQPTTCSAHVESNRKGSTPCRRCSTSQPFNTRGGR